jgi:hypothetical protein
MRNIFIVFIALLAFVSCKEEEPDNILEPTIDTYRVKKMIYFRNNSDSVVTTFFYEGERLIKTVSNSENKKSKTEYNYENNRIIGVQSGYNTDLGRWNPFWKDEFVLENENLTELIKYLNYGTNDWQLQHKTTYQYEDNKIISWEFFDVSQNGTLILIQGGEFTYSNNKLVEYNGYYTHGTENMTPGEKIVFIYSGDKLSEIRFLYLDKNGNEATGIETKYYYFDNKISSYVYREYDHEKDYWIISTKDFKYDTNGNLIEEISDEGNRVKYEYEKGRGNARLLLVDPINLTLAVMPRLKSAIVNNSLSSIGFSLFELPKNMDLQPFRGIHTN